VVQRIVGGRRLEHAREQSGLRPVELVGVTAEVAACRGGGTGEAVSEVDTVATCPPRSARSARTAWT
jgi:hypothetical protein